MAHTDWMIRGPEIASCNCSYGCPCQFNALPTDCTCRAAVGTNSCALRVWSHLRNTVSFQI